MSPAGSLIAEGFVSRSFRASRRFELRSFEKLPTAQREALAGLGEEEDFYGLLLPVDDPNLGTKAVDCDTALLLLSMAEPGPLPHFVQSRPGGGRREIAQLVLDGALETEDDDGRFVSGPAARGLVYRRHGETGAEPGESADRLGALAIRALRYAESLHLEDAGRLSARLYAYNTLPASPRRRRLVGDAAAASRLLGLAPGEANESALREAYAEHGEGGGWRNFALRGRPDAGAAASDDGVAGTLKLYVSPHFDVLGEVFPLVVDAFREHGVPYFKVGRDLGSLLRPDKIVAYLGSRETLHRLAETLRRRLDGLPAQGVPFTGSLSGDGMLSWGLDPEPDAAVEGWQGRESWRLWIVRRLAWALLRGRSPDADAAAETEAWRFALDRLRLDGVDTTTWTPADVALPESSLAKA